MGELEQIALIKQAQLQRGGSASAAIRSPSASVLDQVVAAGSTQDANALESFQRAPNFRNGWDLAFRSGQFLEGILANRWFLLSDKRAFRRAPAMVMTTMVIIIPQLQPPLAARGSPTIDEVSPGDHAADARQGGCWHLGAS